MAEEADSEHLIGLAAPACVGLRVKLSKKGEKLLEETELGLKASKGRPGYITKVHHEFAAVMVHWDASEVDEEAGWYRTGAYGDYTLQLFDVANSETEIEIRTWTVEQDLSADAYIQTVAPGNL